jgi:hypothetical protein
VAEIVRSAKIERSGFSQFFQAANVYFIILDSYNYSPPMIEKHLDEAIVIAERYKSFLAEDHNNFSYKLSLLSVQKHIADLQAQLKKEKEKDMPEFDAEAWNGQFEEDVLTCRLNALAEEARRKINVWNK